MEGILIWGYIWYQSFKKWYYTNESVSYYMISEEGKQIPIFQDCDEPIWGFLTVYNTNYNYKYKFTPNYVIDDATIPTYRWIGLQVTVHGINYTLQVNEFLVIPTILFTNPMKLWLCHHLHVEPTTEMEIRLIDENVNIRTISTTIELHKDNYIEQA
jgi:hypothetical protein